MISTLDIAWLAGLVEGEGWIGLQQKKYPSVVIRMADKDVIERAANLFKTRCLGPYKTREHYKDTWLCQVNGAKAASWMMTLYTLFGERRKAAAANAINVWKTIGSDRKAQPARARRGEHTPAQCHPDRPVRAFGMCKQCYMKQYRAA